MQSFHELLIFTRKKQREKIAGCLDLFVNLFDDRCAK